MSTQQSISGNVTTNNGESLPGVVITAESDNLPTRSTVTNANGHYSFREIPVGNYTIQATMTGFKTVRHPNVIVELGRNVHLDIVMEPSSEH